MNVFLGSDLDEVELEDAAVYVMVFYCVAIGVVLVLDVYLYLNRSQDGVSDYCASARPQEEEIELDGDSSLSGSAPRSVGSAWMSSLL